MLRRIEYRMTVTFEIAIKVEDWQLLIPCCELGIRLVHITYTSQAQRLVQR